MFIVYIQYVLEIHIKYKDSPLTSMHEETEKVFSTNVLVGFFTTVQVHNLYLMAELQENADPDLI